MSKPTLTRNIDSLLKEYASATYTPLEQCDFKLLGTVTYVKYPNDESFSKIPEEVYKEYAANIENTIKDKVNINQVYKIELYTTEICTIKLEYQVHFDPDSIHPKLIIYPNSHIPYRVMKARELYVLLINEVNKIKAKYRILVNFHDQKMLEDLKRFIKHLYAGKFKKPVRVSLFDGVDAELSTESSMDLIFKRKTSPNHQLIEIDKGETILEYRKPVFGTNGFNCFGKQIDHGDLEAKSFDLEVDHESIETIEKDNKLILKARKKGYVDYKDGYIAVNNVVKLNKINRVQSRITDDEDNEIEIVVAQNDITRDSIGEGSQVVSERVHINGHTGANSIVEATELIIDGATHKDSKSFAKNAKIYRHKGTLRCHKADVNILEGGRIHASYVEVGTCLGGSIYAKEVVIDHVKKHLSVYASNSITIRLVSGEDNNFIIDYSKIPVITSQLSLIDADIDDLKFKLEDAEKSQKKGEMLTLTEQIKKLQDEKSKIQNSVFDAHIDIKNPLTGLNTVKFILPNNEEILYKTNAKKYEAFHLLLKEDTVTLQPVGITREI